MLVLITYDVDTKTESGNRRLRKIAKQCVNYGQRVQKSVFECKLDAAQYRLLKATLCDVMDESVDSLRFYKLGDNYHNKVEHFGKKPGYKPDEPLII